MFLSPLLEDAEAHSQALPRVSFDFETLLALREDFVCERPRHAKDAHHVAVGEGRVLVGEGSLAHEASSCAVRTKIRWAMCARSRGEASNHSRWTRSRANNSCS